jgi:hypothetical protein
VTMPFQGLAASASVATFARQVNGVYEVCSLHGSYRPNTGSSFISAAGCEADLFHLRILQGRLGRSEE